MHASFITLLVLVLLVPASIAAHRRHKAILSTGRHEDLFEAVATVGMVISVYALLTLIGIALTAH